MTQEFSSGDQASGSNPNWDAYRRQWAAHRRQRRQAFGRTQGIGFALTIMAVGVLFLLNNMGAIDFGIRQAWPLFLVIPGAMQVLRARSSGEAIGGLIMTSIGSFFLIRVFNFEIPGFTEWFWPALLIGAGIIMLVNHFNREADRDHWAGWDAQSAQPPNSGDSWDPSDPSNRSRR